MDSIQRFVKAVEYLKPLAKKPTNEGVAMLLKYKTLSYISDVIGGSKPITDFLLERMVDYSINPNWILTGEGEMLLKSEGKTNKSEYTIELNQLLPLGDLKITLKDYVDLLEDKARRAEEREQRLLAILEKDMSALKANSETIQADLEQVARMVRADDMEIMEGTDKTLGRESGTTATRAGIVERAFSEADRDIHTNPSTGKRDNSGKEKKQGT